MSLSQDVILAASARSQQEYYGKKKARAKAAKRKRAPKGTGTCLTAPWNRLTPESEMRLVVCDSIRLRLWELENQEWEARYGRAVSCT